MGDIATLLCLRRFLDRRFFVGAGFKPARTGNRRGGLGIIVLAGDFGIVLVILASSYCRAGLKPAPTKYGKNLRGKELFALFGCLR